MSREKGGLHTDYVLGGGPVARTIASPAGDQRAWVPGCGRVHGRGQFMASAQRAQQTHREERAIRIR